MCIVGHGGYGVEVVGSKLLVPVGFGMGFVSVLLPFALMESNIECGGIVRREKEQTSFGAHIQIPTDYIESQSHYLLKI
jgi:hypothetical protein